MNITDRYHELCGTLDTLNDEIYKMEFVSTAIGELDFYKKTQDGCSLLIDQHIRKLEELKSFIEAIANDLHKEAYPNKA